MTTYADLPPPGTKSCFLFFPPSFPPSSFCDPVTKNSLLGMFYSLNFLLCRSMNPLLDKIFQTILSLKCFLYVLELHYYPIFTCKIFLFMLRHLIALMVSTYPVTFDAVSQSLWYLIAQLYADLNEVVVMPWFMMSSLLFNFVHFWKT